jgi:hypothetical protein
MAWGCVQCEHGVRVCGNNVTEDDCFVPEFAHEECDDRYGWICRFKYSDEHDWTSFWLHKQKPDVCALSPYRGWHEKCKWEGLP